MRAVRKASFALRVVHRSTGKAAVIYRRLLMQAPERDDLRHRLAAIDAKQKQAEGQGLAEQFGEWVQLLMKKKQIEALRNLRKRR